MGGREVVAQRDLADRELWITEVSDERFRMYERVMLSEGRSVRADGATPRPVDTQGYFRDLVDGEMRRRNLRT